MTETARQKVVFSVLEDLLESKQRTVVHVWAAAQPLSGDELDQVAEERALAGLCGSAMCMRPLPLTASGMRRALTRTTFCSSECEAAVQQLIRGLGTVEAARQRFLLQQQRQQPAVVGGSPLEALSHPGFAPGGVISHGSRPGPAGQAAEELAAARGGGVDVMSAVVKERLPAKAIFEPYDEPAADVTAMQVDPAAQQAPPPAPAADPVAPAAAPHPGAETPHPAPPAPASESGQQGSKGRVKFAEKDDFQHIGGQQGSQAAAAAAPERAESPIQDPEAAAWAALEAAQQMQRQIGNQHRVRAEQQRLQQEQQQRQARQQARREERQQRQQQVGVAAASPQGPVLVLDLDEQGGAELGQVFGNLQVRDASDIAVDPTSATAEAASAFPAASSPVEETVAVGDIVFERSPTAAAAPAAAPAADQQDSRRRPSRFSLHKHTDRQHPGDLQDGAADPAAAAPPGSAAELLDTAGAPGQREGSGGSSRKRRQQQEGPLHDEATEAEAEAIWATASTPSTAAPGPDEGSKAAAGGARGRPPRPQPLLADTVSERLPGHLGSSVVQQAAALADLAALSGSDGASFLKQVGHDASGGGEGASDGGAGGESESESESGTSEQGAFLGALPPSHLEPESDEESDSQMPLPFPEMSPFGRLYTLLDAWATRATLDYVQGKGGTTAADPDTAPRAAAFSRSLLGRLPHLMQELKIGGVPRATLERALQDLVVTLDFADAIGSLHVHQWEVAVLVLLKALSFEVVAPLQPALETRSGIASVSKALKTRGLTEEHFACLLEVLCPDD